MTSKMVRERFGGRRSIRLPEYDYSQDGGYFVTICTRNHKTYFEHYEELRKIVEREWLNIPKRFCTVQLDEFVVMPNHVHGIIIIVGATLAVAQNERARASLAPTSTNRHVSPTIGRIIGAFKSSSANAWLRYVERHRCDAPVRFWQRNYYEHVIRNEYDLNEIRKYIIENPLKWALDEENPERDMNM